MKSRTVNCVISSMRIGGAAHADRYYHKRIDAFADATIVVIAPAPPLLGKQEITRRVASAPFVVIVATVGLARCGRSISGVLQPRGSHPPRVVMPGAQGEAAATRAIRDRRR